MISSSKKALGLTTISGLLLIASFYALILPFQQEFNLFYWFWVALLLMITLISLSLTSLFPYSYRTFMAVAALTSVSILAFGSVNLEQIIAVIAVFASLLLMNRLINRAEKDSLHFSFYRTARQAMTWFLTGVILLIALNVYTITAEKLTDNPEVFYQNIGATVVKSLQPVLQSKIRGFTPSMTLDQFLVNSELFGGPENQTLPELRENFIRSFGVEASGNEQILPVLHRLVTARAKETLGPIERFIPAIYALLLFLSLRFIIPIIAYLAAGLGTLFFKGLVRINFIRMTEKTVTVEIPELT